MPIKPQLQTLQRMWNRPTPEGNREARSRRVPQEASGDVPALHRKLHQPRRALKTYTNARLPEELKSVAAASRQLTFYFG